MPLPFYNMIILYKLTLVSMLCRMTMMIMFDTGAYGFDATGDHTTS